MCPIKQTKALFTIPKVLKLPRLKIYVIERIQDAKKFQVRNGDKLGRTRTEVSCIEDDSATQMLLYASV